MISLDKFKKLLKEQLPMYLSKEQKEKGVEIEYVVCNKVNGTKEGLHIIDPSKSNDFLATVYLEDMYEYFNQGESMTSIIHHALYQLENDIKKSEIEDFMNLIMSAKESGSVDSLKENLIVCAVNTKENKELLRTTPHMKLNDLSFICRIVDDTLDKSTIVNDNLQKILGISTEELFAKAKESVLRKFPPVIKSLDQIIQDIMQRELGFAPEESSNRGDIPMYIVCNSQKMYGAGLIFYPEVLDQIYDSLKSDFFILPSSIHECIVVPKLGFEDIETLAATVKDINHTSVQNDEVLSDNIYFYSKEKRKLQQLTNNGKEIKANITQNRKPKSFFLAFRYRYTINKIKLTVIAKRNISRSECRKNVSGRSVIMGSEAGSNNQKSF